MKTVIELRRRNAEIRSEMEMLNEAAGAETRDLNESEQSTWESLTAEAKRNQQQINRLETIGALPTGAGKPDPQPQQQRGGMAPAFLRSGRGDSAERAMLWYIRTGDGSGLAQRDLDEDGETRAANDTIMNATTGADGEYAVPDVQHNAIIAKAGETWLAPRLGLMELPAGPGKTVYVPYDNEADVEFYAGTEQIDDYSNTFTRSSPAIGQATMTMARRDISIPLTLELIEWEDAALLTFLNNYIGRAYAKDNNGLLVTAAASGATAYNLASASAIAAGEVNGIVYAVPEGYENTSWLMRKATYGSIASLQGTDFLFQMTPAGMSDTGRPELVASPVFFSANVAAIAASAKSFYFGDFTMMGYRNSGLRFQRNPYRTQGVVYLEYHYWAVYTVLIAEAIRVGTHPSA